MKILVAGGAGHIGSAFVRRRLKLSSDQIIVLDKLTYSGNRTNLAEVELDATSGQRLRLVVDDIADRSAVERLVLDEDVDAIVNFAAESHVDRSILDATAFLRTGLLGVQALLDSTRRLTERRRANGGRPPRMVQVSTDEVYGPTEEASLESDPLRPHNPYSVAKAAGDLLVQAYRTTYGIDTVITRGANTFGPYQFPEKIIPLFVTNAIRGLQLPLYGDGLQRRQWLHVDDHADGIALALDRGEEGGIYNLPGSHETTNLALTLQILQLLGLSESLIRHVADRPGHDRRYAMGGGRIAELGWSHKVGFHEGLAETVAWYRANEAWWRDLIRKEQAFFATQYGDRLGGD
jgi:dTDP-glucose 4,6-dehydratase